MQRQSLYSGPGKIYMSNVVLWPQGENGEINLAVNQATDEVGSGMHGHVDDTVADTTVGVSVTPFDNWGALGLLYPAYIRTVVVGTRIFTAADVPCKIWTPDQRLYTIAAAAVTRHPDLQLGVGQPLFGQATITGVIGNNKAIGDANAFYTLALAQADPGGQMTLADFIRGPWVGAWGAVAGFGAVESEENWTISVEARYKPLVVGKLTRDMELLGVRIMARTRPVGPTQAQIDTQLKIQSAGGALGRRLGASGADLVLTGPAGKTITLKNASLVTAGYDFGGTKLGNGEIGFVVSTTFAAGVAQPLIAFSA